MAVSPFNVTFTDVPDERLSDLLAATNAAGFPSPSMVPTETSTANASARTADPLNGDADLPDEWRLVREMTGQSFVWPAYREHYESYAVYAGETVREGTVHIALGKAGRERTWGRDRLYVVAFLTSGSPQTALAEFLETDDFDESREFIAVIRGRDGAGSKKMFGPGDSLPQVYLDRFKTVMYNDYIRVQGAWSKLAVLAHEDSPETMLNHALLQARRRGNL